MCENAGAPLRLNKSLHLEGDTVPTRWRFYSLVEWDIEMIDILNHTR